jgi:adenylosuccinate lyase
MKSDQPQNSLYERYASAEMKAIFSSPARYRTWRRVWLALAESQQELGLPISDRQIEELRRVADEIDFERVAELEAETRHDVVAHLRHFAELAAEAGGILHLGATSAFVTDNTDLILLRRAMGLLLGRTATLMAELARFARSHAALPTLAFTHLQPAQLTTVGKRACLWLQDFLLDHQLLERMLEDLPARGAKGTTGTQASYLTLFDGDHEKVRQLDALVAERLGFPHSFAVTGQTYPRKLDSRLLAALSGIGESCHKLGTDLRLLQSMGETCHKLGTDLRLLQSMGEISEPFDSTQVGSSAMAYKRNPVRAERMCSLSRRLISDSLNGGMTAAIQWLERSLDDSANRRLVLPDACLMADAVLNLASGIVAGLRVHSGAIEAHVRRELPFMASETFLMQGTLRGGDRQELHEIIRRLSMEAHQKVEAGEENPLVSLIAAEPAFGLSREEAESLLDPQSFTGRSAQQVEDFLSEVVDPLLETAQKAATEEPKV